MDPAALNLTTSIIGYGRFLFLHLDRNNVDKGFVRSLASLGKQLENAHFARGIPADSVRQQGLIQYLRAEPGVVREGELKDEGVSGASVLIRLEGTSLGPLVGYETELRELVRHLGGEIHPRHGIQKPRSYTSYAMTQFAYARAHLPAPGTDHPIGVFTPQSKTKEWWEMDWMRRESLFLARYDEHGNVVAKGHTLAAAAGIPCVTRRLYHHPQGYDLDSGYDFIGYFEFSEDASPIFRQVMTNLRDTTQNPEWSFVREGPEWWGRRVGSAGELWP